MFRSGPARRQTGVPAGPRLGNAGAAICFSPQSCGHSCRPLGTHMCHPAAHTKATLGPCKPKHICARVHAQTARYSHEHTVSLQVRHHPCQPPSCQNPLPTWARPGHLFFLPTFCKPFSPTLSGGQHHPHFCEAPSSTCSQGQAAAHGRGGACTSPLPPRLPSSLRPWDAPLPS